MASAGQNVEIEVKGDKVTITVDLSGAGIPSASGKTLVIASTRGNAAIAPGVFMGLNVYRKK
jgi:hypothetical protein